MAAMNSTADRIREKRLQQPLGELLRKRDKARRRAIWTQEDIDHAEVWAKDFLRKLNAVARIGQDNGDA
jgi:chorismate-pyruvate lyase